MSKIHDWRRRYWRNADGSREFFPGDVLDEDDVTDQTRAVYLNEEGDRVEYQVADEDADHGNKYEVLFNGDIISGEQVPEVLENHDIIQLVDPDEVSEDTDDEEEEASEPSGPTEYPEQAVFQTRKQAREFSRHWREQFASPEDLGYKLSADEVGDVDADNYEIGDLNEEELEALDDYPLLRQMAKTVGIKGNQSGEALIAQLSGEADPELTQAEQEDDSDEESDSEAEAEAEAAE